MLGHRLRPSGDLQVSAVYMVVYSWQDGQEYVRCVESSIEAAYAKARNLFEDPNGGPRVEMRRWGVGQVPITLPGGGAPCKGTIDYQVVLLRHGDSPPVHCVPLELDGARRANLDWVTA